MIDIVKVLRHAACHARGKQESLGAKLDKSTQAVCATLSAQDRNAAVCV